MTIKSFKAFSKTSIVLAASVTLMLSTVSVSNAASQSIITWDEGAKMDQCVKDGGTKHTSPSGTSCLNPKTGELTICGLRPGKFQNCATDIPSRGKPIGDKFGKPAIGGGTMVMPPDTNTTVDSGMNPLNGKLIMRNVIQK